MTLDEVAFDALPGWNRDTLEGVAAALIAVPHDVASANLCALFGVPAAHHNDVEHAVRAIWSEAQLLAAEGDCAARNGDIGLFFENHFRPYRRRASDGSVIGCVTGYYEPDVRAARTKSVGYSVPLLSRPPDLVNLVPEAGRALGSGQLTHARRTDNSCEPYATRAEIEMGALSGRGLEFAWLADPVEAFFLHVQGSGRLVFEDGSHLRVTYDGKNGHPYTSIGAELISEGRISREQMSLETLGDWLRAHPDAGREIMRRNRSYVFFRPLRPGAADAAHGVLESPLHAMRSLAVDTRFHALGAPVFVHAPDLVTTEPPRAPDVPGFARLMLAHDVGSAIKGPHRGDIFFGAGPAAGRLAGHTNHAAELYPLLPRVLSEATGAL